MSARASPVTVAPEVDPPACTARWTAVMRSRITVTRRLVVSPGASGPLGRQASSPVRSSSPDSTTTSVRGSSPPLRTTMQWVSASRIAAMATLGPGAPGDGQVASAPGSTTSRISTVRFRCQGGTGQGPAVELVAAGIGHPGRPRRSGGGGIGRRRRRRPRRGRCGRRFRRVRGRRGRRGRCPVRRGRGGAQVAGCADVAGGAHAGVAQLAADGAPRPQAAEEQSRGIAGDLDLDLAPSPASSAASPP